MSMTASKTSDVPDSANGERRTQPLPPLRVPTWLRYVDLLALLAALPLFLLADLPLLRVTGNVAVGKHEWIRRRLRGARPAIYLHRGAGDRQPVRNDRHTPEFLFRRVCCPGPSALSLPISPLRSRLAAAPRRIAKNRTL